MLKLLRALLFIVALLVVVMLAISNRQLIPVSFWPLPLAYDFPVYGVFLVALFVGAFLGGIAVWLGGHATRVDRRRLKRTVGYVEQQDRQRQEAEEAAIVEAARRRTQNLPPSGALPAPTRA